MKKTKEELEKNSGMVCRIPRQICGEVNTCDACKALQQVGERATLEWMLSLIFYKISEGSENETN